MTTPAKFIIQNEFNGSGSELKRLEHELAVLKESIPIAEQRGYRAAQNEGDTLLASTISRLAQGLIQNFDKERVEIETQAVNLAVQIARSLAGQLLDAEPAAAVTAMAASCIESLRKCPHIVFHVHPDSVASVEQQLKKLSYERGLEGRLIVLGDPDKAPGDCKIEWADGGFERNQNDITQKIDEAVTRFLAARGGAKAPDGDIA